MNNRIKSNFCNAVLLIVIQFIFACVTYASELVYLSKDKCSTAHGVSGEIDEAGYVEIAGIRQWLTIRGKNCSNPVILFVHGGPGNPMSLFSETLYKEWEDKFTIVQWDQRGAGKTYEANQTAGEITNEILNESQLTLPLIVNDGLLITDFLLKKMDKKSIILTGSSWGSVVSVKMISEKPELFKFYVGLSQVVNYNKNLLNSYENASNISRKNEDGQSIAILNAIGSPPWKDPRSFGKLRKIIKNIEASSTDDPVVLKAGSKYISEQYKAAYTSGEDFSFIKYVGLDGNGIAQSIELDKTDFKFKIPIYLIQGEEDLLTSKVVTEKYFKSIKAPFKKFVVVPKSGHDPNNRMLNAQLLSLQEGAKKF